MANFFQMAKNAWFATVFITRLSGRCNGRVATLFETPRSEERLRDFEEAAHDVLFSDRGRSAGSAR